MKRRGFLLATTAGALGLGAAGWWVLRPTGHPLARVIHAHLSFLRLEAVELARFIADHERAFPRFASRLESATGDERRKLERQLVSDFLLSSDFFSNGADEGRPVRHLALYDPRRVGCRNPFARFDSD
jgi:hypothetical protein